MQEVQRSRSKGCQVCYPQNTKTTMTSLAVLYHCDSDSDSQDCGPEIFKCQKHSKSLMNGFHDLRDRKQLFDVTLIAEGQEFPAHRVVLAACSDYFLAMFTNGLKESFQHSIQMHGVSAEVLGELIHFAYTSEIKITNENVVELLAGASQFQIPFPLKACVNYLSDHLTLNNCAEIDKVADMYSLHDVRRQVHCFMCEHWLSFSKTPEFLALSLEHLTCILQSDFPVYCAELEVLKSLFAWLHHDLAQRVSCLPDLLSLVKYENLQKTDVAKLLHSPEIMPVLNEVDCSCAPTSVRNGNRDSVHTVFPRNQAEDSLALTFQKNLDKAGTNEVRGVVNARGYFQTILMMGGFYFTRPAWHSDSNVIWYLDLDSQTFVRHTTIPRVNQAGFGVEVLDNHVYIVGGCYNENFSDVSHPDGFCFDASIFQWTTIPCMWEERCRFYLGSLNGLLYAVGGDMDNSKSLDDCERFDPKKCEWNPISPLPAPRSELAGASLGGKLYVAGGTGENLELAQNEMWCYDPEDNAWTACAPMLSARADHTMFTFDDHLYVIGGWSTTFGIHESVASVDRYSADTNRWETVQHVNNPRKHCSYTLLRGQIYVIGGSKETSQGDEKAEELDVLDLASMKWLPSSISLPAVWEHCTVPVHLPRKV